MLTERGVGKSFQEGKVGYLFVHRMMEERLLTAVLDRGCSVHVGLEHVYTKYDAGYIV